MILDFFFPTVGMGVVSPDISYNRGCKFFPEGLPQKIGYSDSVVNSKIPTNPASRKRRPFHGD